MKGILPPPCRWAGYALLLLSVFVPMLMYMFGMIDDGNLLYVKLGMKSAIWIALFMIFLARTKDECEAVASIRARSMKYALYIWGVCYLVLLALAAAEHDLSRADNSIGIVYMVINVLCMEFLHQKYRMERMFGRRRTGGRETK